MLAGAMETFDEAGVALIGGHSVKDEEIKLGFAITGLIDPAVAAALENPRPGDVLVLTKPLGTGVLAFAEQVGRGHAEGMAAAQSSMATLNQAAAEAMKEVGASACTDITGFGLFGHLIRMLRQGRLAARVFADSLPAFPGVMEALRQGVVPGAIERNREYVGDDLRVAPMVEESCVHLGCDAQTSGGLLIAVAPARLDALRQALRARKVDGFVIGGMDGGPSGQILLARSSEDLIHSPSGQSHEPLLSHPTMNPQMPAGSSAHDGCCADVFQSPQASAAGASSAPESQRAFGALMRSAQAGGVLPEKTKELVLFSLVVLSRCESCFEAHYQKARQMGITEAELEEAAWCAIATGGAPVRMFYQECLERP